MPAVPVRVDVLGGKQFRDLSRRLKQVADGELLNELRRNIRREGQPTVEAVQRAARAVHVTSKLGGAGHPQGSTNLRGRVADATRVSAAADGIRIEVVGSRVGPYGTKLSNALDNRVRWTHPVFGNRHLWETQHGQEFFASTIEQHAPQFREACAQAIEDIIRKLGG